MNTYAQYFSRFLQAKPGRLHVAAHSHHPWPDVTFEAQQKAWLDAARLIDDKWDEIFGSVLPEAAAHITGRLGLSDPEAIAFAPSTHALVMRLLSCLTPPVRILTTDAEFHSFARQAARLEEDGLAAVERIPAEPFATFPDRFADAARRGAHDLVYLSHVFFNSGYVVPDLAEVVGAIPDPGPVIVIDGYHGFMALPTDLSGIEDRAFYVAGGYKYAMAGEGACFAHSPPGYAERPRDTGWFAGFAELSSGSSGKVAYAPGGARLLGATLDPTGLYRFNAVQRWLDDLGITVADIHAHVGRLQDRFLDAGPHPELLPPAEAPAGPGAAGDAGRDSGANGGCTVGKSADDGGRVAGDRGHFLTFRLPDAAAVHAALHAAGVITDYRDDRLRIGFGLYHEDADIDELLRRLTPIPGWP